MKTVPEMKALILSDGKPGHLNQSIAFARQLGSAYEVVEVAFASRPAKALSYLLDRLGIYRRSLFDVGSVTQGFSLIVSAGSGTYYANKTLGRAFGLKSVAIMLPRGYRYDFDLIIAQSHDNPPVRANLLEVPINLAYVEPKGNLKVQPGECYVSIIVGGDSAQGSLEPRQVKEQIVQIRKLFPQHKLWMTTSRRTSEKVEQVLRTFDFDWGLYYSEQQLNPIADFLEHSDYVFITADSTSMISEAVSYGQANIELLPLCGERKTREKTRAMVVALTERSCLHVFDGSVAAAHCKIRLDEMLSPEVVQRMLDLT
jgi:mitochondrial fission protein ELM1